MGMPDVARAWTREMVLSLPDDGNRYELFGGELLVTPAPKPRHQVVVSAFQEVLMPYLRTAGLGYILSSPADVSLDGEQLAQPDLFVVPGARGPAPAHWSQLPQPLLIIEVLSPSTARFDRQIKRRWFQRVGIPEYWIIDLDARQIERWRPEDERPEVLDESIEWNPSGATVPLNIDLVALFAEVLGPA
jgi:Uma2 family endonuclease